MKFNFTYEIADSARRDVEDGLGNSKTYNDMSYTLPNVHLFFNGKSGKADQYMENCSPDEKEIKEIVDDITKYYQENFAYSTSEKKYDVVIRFYFHLSPRSRNGDYSNNTIRIFCKKIAIGKEVNDTRRVIAQSYAQYNYQEKEYYQNYLRFLLAHEMYHLFHEKEYVEVNGKTINTVVTTTNSRNNINAILMESFAQYFALCYMEHILPSKEDINRVKYNHVTPHESYIAKLFGIGRKHYLSKYYAQKIIEEDNAEFYRRKSQGEFSENECLMVEIQTGSDAGKTIYIHEVWGADYGGGFWLKLWGTKEGKQGRKFAKYDAVFNDMQHDQLEEALKKMLEYKDTWP